MARIIYGVAGQGFGHSTRSKEMIKHLVNQGHQVLVMTYGQALFFLEKDFEVLEIPGFVLSYKNNKLSYWETIFKNTKQLLKQTKNWKDISQKFKAFKPDMAITDFEPLTCLLAKQNKIPLLSIDNQHQLTNTKISCKGHKKDLLAAQIIVKSMVWGAKKYFVTTFYKTPLLRKDTYIFPPIVRQEVLDLKTERQDYILIYQNSDFDHLINIYKKIPEKFIVFGLNKEGTDKNITYKNYSLNEWLNYLANCKAIIATAGLSLMCEALYLKKPLLAIPIDQQVEQVINAQYLQAKGYGRYTLNFCLEDYHEFKKNLPLYEKNLETYEHKDNSLILQKLDEVVNSWT
ncbi:MAG: glycosyltransferase family protein [Patescibacteria group bacterium]|jgi:uncharacterized protein (TIGR00661 family)